MKENPSWGVDWNGVKWYIILERTDIFITLRETGIRHLHLFKSSFMSVNKFVIFLIQILYQFLCYSCVFYIFLLLSKLYQPRKVWVWNDNPNCQFHISERYACLSRAWQRSSMLNKWMNEHMNEWMNEWQMGPKAPLLETWAIANLPQCSLMLKYQFYIFKVKYSYNYFW